MDIVTYQDAYDYLVAQFDILTDLSQGERQSDQAREAIQAANRQLPLIHPWTYYDRRWYLKTEAPYSTGTVAYTHSTRTVTLTSGTFPTNAADMRIKIGSEDVRYPVDSRTDDTNIILPVGNNPGADVAAGATFDIARDQYTLPVDFHRMASLFDRDLDYELPPAPSGSEAHAVNIDYTSPSRPIGYVIDSDYRYLGALQLRFVPMPLEARSYEYSYKAKARPLVIHKKSLTISGTAGGTTVTISVGDDATSSWEGSIIRFSSTATEPTGMTGATPYVEYRVVSSVTSTTTLELDAALSNTYSSTAAVISDPVDIEPVTMWEAFKAVISRNFGALTRDENLPLLEGMCDKRLREAAAADWRKYGSRTSHVTPYGIYGWSTVPAEEVPG